MAKKGSRQGKQNWEERAEFVLELKKKHHTYIVQTMCSPAFKNQLSHKLQCYQHWFLQQKLRDVTSPQILKKAVNTFLKQQNLESIWSGFIAPVVEMQFGRLQNSSQKLERIIPSAAQEKLLALIEKPSLFPGAVFQKSFKHKAFHQLMAALLYNTLKEFTIQVNPFFSSWGLPSLLKKTPLISSFNMGTLLLDSVKQEFEKQLEPQIKNFLALFTEQALQFVHSFITDSTHQELFVQFRKDFLAILLEEKVSTLSGSFSVDDLRLVNQCLGSVLDHYFQQKSTLASIEKALERFCATSAEQTIGEILEEYGFTVHDWSEDFLELTWPVFEAFTRSEEWTALVKNLIDDFYDQELTHLSEV